MALEGAYNFDTDGTDYSGNGRTLTLGANGVSVSGGHTNNGFGKTGATMPVFPGSLLTATQTDDRCVMFWAKGNLTTWWVRWQKDAINSGTWGVLNVSGSMAIQARRASDDSLLTRPTGTAPSTTWHHYCATYTRSTGVCRLLVDGVQTGTQSFTAGTQLTINADRIDMAEWSTTGAAIDDLRFFSHVPTDSEITTFMNTPVTSGDTALPDVAGSVRVAKTADAAAVGVALPDVVGAARTGNLSESAAIGVTVADAVRGVRVAGGTDTTLIGVAVPDVATSVRAQRATDGLTVGVVLADASNSVRLSTATTDTVAVGVAVADVVSATRVTATTTAVSVGVALPDVPGTLRAGSPLEVLSAGVVLADSPPSTVRLSGQLVDVATNSLLLPDTSASAVRVGAPAETVTATVVLADTAGVAQVRGTVDTAARGVTLTDQPGPVRVTALAEAVTNSTILTDQSTSSRVLPTLEQTAAGIVLLDVITAVSVWPLTEAVAAGVALGDPATSVTARGLAETLQQPLQDVASSVRVATRPMVLVGAVPATQRDITVYVRALDSRWDVAPIRLGRWHITPAPDRWDT